MRACVELSRAASSGAPARPAALRGDAPGIRLRRLPPPLFRPEGLPATPGLRGLAEARLRFATNRDDVAASGAGMPGCEIKEEVLAEGRRRGRRTRGYPHPAWRPAPQ